jgi:hypothetical protein
MNTGMERRPFKVLRPDKQSTAMVIARYSGRVPAVIGGPEPPEPDDLLWKALRVAGVCAACAFTFFLLSERNLLRRSGEIASSAPITTQRVRYSGTNLPNAPALSADAKSLSLATESPSIPLPDDKSLKVTEFALSVSPEFQDLDGVQLRLMGLNPTTNTYDITVRTRGREFYRQDAKVNEHIALSKRSKNGGELVVGAISENRVFGYLSEPHGIAGHAHPRHHRHNRS